MYVIDNENQKSIFKPSKIKHKIMVETGLDEETAHKITLSVTKAIKNQYTEEVSTSTIRSLINAQLVKRGLIEEEGKSRKLGMSVSDYEDLLEHGCKDNANINFTPEMISKYAYDSIAKEYALLTQPEECANAHIEGFIHQHDLEYYNTRPNCMNYDLRFFAKNGLMIDGIGLMGSSAKPAKSFEVILNHMLQAWMAGATVFSGGQGYVNFNTLLAPFVRGRPYNEIKQAIQGFIFNCNMSLICRGGQVLFSSIGLDMRIPDELKNEPAIGIGGVPNGVYADYQNEADMIFKAVSEVSNEKDGNGAYHRFPNIIINIRKGDLDTYDGNCKILHEWGANNPTIYYVNCYEQERTIMGCRTALPMNYTGEYEKDCCNTGNFMYNTINLPLIALSAKDNVVDFIGKDYYFDYLEQEFYSLLNYYCEIIYKSLHHRRKEVIKSVYETKMSNFLLQKDKDTGESLWDIDRTTITIGYCGLNECLMELYNGEGIIYHEEEGIKIIEMLNKKKDEFYERDGLRWSVIGSPAESTSHRFAVINKSKYPNAFVQGEKDSYYLTNSSHVPVSENVNIVSHIKNAGNFHKISQGGNILHIWLGEVWSDPIAIWKLNQKIIETDTLFWAYSKVFTYCNECGETINDEIDKCQKCGSTDLVTYDRITGYYLPTNGYNNGKQQEFKDRYRQKIEGE